jgi:hypothetical protein
LKTSLAYLPENKQEELKEICELIMEEMQPAMIMLFGSRYERPANKKGKGYTLKNQNKIKVINLFFLFIILGSQIGYSQVKNEHQSVVNNFIDLVKTNNKTAVANLITYPFNREYPIPSVKNKQEFIKRYEEIFDDTLKNMIIRSKSSTNWSEVGWRGIMINRGDLWIDYDGRLIAINYQSEFEKELRNKLIESERNHLHPSVRNYKSPICILETAKFRIRIDDLGNSNYRYSSWLISKPMSDKPDLILANGVWIPEGSGGNHRYEFKNGEYKYECSIIVMGEEGSPPASLTVYKGDQEILTQNAKPIVK